MHGSMLRGVVFSLAAPLALLGAQQQVTDAPDRTPSDFIRFVGTKEGGHLDTAITTYRKDDVELVLFGAVHIADRACYQQLNERFKKVDVLLYELVARPDDRPSRQRDEGVNPLAMLQRGMKNALGMTFQLDEIDYGAANFVHADMTPSEFQDSMELRGESLFSMLVDVMVTGMKAQKEQQEKDAEAASAAGEAPKADPYADLVKAWQTGTGRHSLRMMAAQQMEQVEMMFAGGEGSTLLEGRNEKCLEVLARELPKGHRRIGIYYGAAHFPHMEARLVNDLGWRKTGHEWLVAWDCTPRPDPKMDRELMQQRLQCREQLRELGKAARTWRDANQRKVPSLADLTAAAGDEKPAYAGPRQDPWGKDFVIRRRSDRRLEVLSHGQDGELGTDDDIVLTEGRR